MLEKMRNDGELHRTDFDPMVQTKYEILSMVIIYSGVCSYEIIKKDEWYWNLNRFPRGDF